MRNSKDFMQRYADVALLSATKSKPTKDMQDTALVDLCLHFLAKNFPGSSVESVPPLLQGHLENHCPESARRGLATIRHMAARFCSRLAWRNAQASHREAQSRTAYVVNNGLPEPQKLPEDEVYVLLEVTLDNAPDYEHREVRFATAGDWVTWIRSQETAIHYAVPAVNQELNRNFELRRRSVNPPIQVRMKDLLDTAREVDAREARSDFPSWLSKLELTARLERVGVECFDNVFFKDGTFTLSGTQHVVGMLSSGKSTLFLALLFLLVRPGYDKRVVVLSSDTASAATLVARLKAHGIEDSTVISSFKNREEHLSAAHWSTSGYPADQRLAAAAAITESLGIACPLEGMQAADREVVLQEDRAHRKSLVPRLSEKPCHGLVASVNSGSGQRTRNLDEPRTCPLITVCPAHAQQHRLPNAKVIVMTPQAFLAMTPEKSVIPETLSFPELFQYAADVVLIDEADGVQQTFDQQCVQDEGLLANDTGAFLPEHQRLIANSLQDRQGSQYARAAPVRWQAAFTRLQSAVAMVYFLLLRHHADLAWITKAGTFTAASILCDLWASGQDSEKAAEDRSRMLEKIAILASTLYGDVVDSGDYNDPGSSGENIQGLGGALSFLSKVQRSLLEQGADDSDSGPLTLIQTEIESGCLQVFAGRTDHVKQGPRKISVKRAPVDSQSRAYAVALALLTNVTLSTYAYLVRNQAAVEDEFRLASTNLFMSARRLMAHYGSLIPRPLYGTVFGLMFEQRSEADAGGALKLVNHLGVGRYLLTNLHRLLKHEGQAGPHVLLMSGTSWAGGDAVSASPRFDVQHRVSAVLRQPPQETKAISQCRFEFVSLGPSPISVSGQPPEIRRENLRKIAELLGQVNPSGTRISQNWKALGERFDADGSFADRQRALLVTNNYRDAKVVANALAKACGAQHTVYCLVPDDVAKADGKERHNAIDGEVYSHQLILLPRSRVETFGQSPSKSILVAPLDPISRGHNIVTGSGIAAISSIYFLHRPHPRPDDMKGVVGMVNRFTMNWINNGTPDGIAVERLAREFDIGARRALDEGFALRTSYKTMGAKARAQYSWDIITQLWQTIGRGIRGGVPVYVGFIDERFAPHTFGGEPQLETSHSSCLLQCMETLQAAIKEEGNQHIADLLYSPFLGGLKQLFKN